MHKITSFMILLFCSINLAFAQPVHNDQRTRETKIADIVMLLPAKDNITLNQLMRNLSELDNVVPELAKKITEPGAGDDSKIRNAISGLTLYAAQGNNKALKKKVAEGLGLAIYESNSNEIKDFLLIQLQYVAGEESVTGDAVAIVKQMLTSPRLCDATTRVLSRINSDASTRILIEALPTATGDQRIAIVEALGNSGNLMAKDAVFKLATGSNDARLQKAALATLANLDCACEDVEKLLYKEAAKAQFMYEPTDAFGSYIRHLNKLSLSSGSKIKDRAEKASKQLITVKAPKESVARFAGLDLYTRTAGEGAMPEIVKALSSPDKKYREAALRASQHIATPLMTTALVRHVKQEKNPAIKAEIITALGIRGDKAALPLVIDILNDKTNNEATVAAIGAAVLLDKVDPRVRMANAYDGEKTLDLIFQSMHRGNPDVVDAGALALSRINNPQISPSLKAHFQQSSDDANSKFIEHIGNTRDTKYANILIEHLPGAPVYHPLGTDSDQSNSQRAAYKALKNVVDETDLANLSGVLQGASPANIGYVQEALFEAVQKNKSSHNNTPQQQSNLIVSQMSAHKNKAHLYYNTLAMIGEPAALAEVNKGFASGDQQVRSSAFEALTKWSNNDANEALYQIAKSADPAYFDKALMAYVSKSAQAKVTNDQKLLTLRRALEIANTDVQKNEIIKQIGRTGVFLAMVTAGEYLDQPNLQQTAVQAIFAVALQSNRYYGPTVNAYLNKAIAVNKDPEAEYQKQAVLKYIADHPQQGGYVSLFNGRDLSGWKGLVENPIARAKMTPAQLAEKQKKADEIMRRDWRVENGILVFDGKGYDNLCSEKDYEDFNLTLDWRITSGGDAGVYLRGTPQVQIWDTALVKVGAQVGSGGLYNNQKYMSKPLVVADNGVNQWNTFRIQMRGDKVTVYLNGQLVTDKVTLENYWDKMISIFPTGAIELQAHGERVEWRNVYVMEVPHAKAYEVSEQGRKDGFVPLFNGIDMSGWMGNLTDYYPKDNQLVCDPTKGGSGNLYTEKEYANFIMRFDFKLTPAANNGLGIRTPATGDAAYVGMELQILDNEAEVYKDLKEYQYHGSVYGVIAAKRGYLKPVGEWNSQEVEVNGSKIKITLNGTVILDGDIATASENYTKTRDGLNHPGLANPSGHIAFLGHGSELAFKNLRIKDLTPPVVKAVKGKKK